ncbi:MAG: hypothetical protein ASARMPRED_005413 [Alectoria sarmentosa]|nr:MAG: hypothetical protein ASARMPRED_005413 [Alectoria sarmentosa]
MSEELPDQRIAWRQAAQRNNIGHNQPLTAGPALVSGSKFKFEHFLRLRVLYIQEQRPEILAETPGFPRERLKEMKRILKEDSGVSFLETFLQDGKDIGTRWNVDYAKKSGKFAVALEHLHLIAKRGVHDMADEDDISDLKIISSPPKTQSVTQSGAHYHRPSLSTPTPSTPTRKPRGYYYESPPTPLKRPPVNDLSDDFDMSSLTISQKEVISPPNSDLRRAKNISERSAFSPGDEQTVNAALVALIMALSWTLGYTGRVHHDRARFSISKDTETDLYAACVDGLVMHLDRDEINGFMEVKPNFRGDNLSVRRQITAQMAAFIFEQDVVLAGKETEKETKKVPKGKGKKAEAKGDKNKDKDGGDQEQ